VLKKSPVGYRRFSGLRDQDSVFQDVLAALDADLTVVDLGDADIRTVDDMNKVWDAWVPAGCAPARASIEAMLQGPEKKVEIRVRRRVRPKSCRTKT
jgi:enamine deaminase RidA (YjgF/YER057c/UK114 family)